MKNECPSCGNTIEDNQPFCPMCGTKLLFVKKDNKQINKELESALFALNATAEIAFEKPIKLSLANYNNLIFLEEEYLKIIQDFPIEAKSYIAYVEYIVRLMPKLFTLPITSDYYPKQSTINIWINRSRSYLTKAKEFANDKELEKILQLESKLSSKIESIANDETVQNNVKKSAKINKWLWIGLAVLMGSLALVWLISKIFGV